MRTKLLPYRAHVPAVPGRVSIRAIPNLLAPHQVWTGSGRALASLREIADFVGNLTRVPRFFRSHGKMWLNGHEIPRAAWDAVLAQDGDHVEFMAMPAGGGVGKLLALVGSIISMVLVPFLAPTIGAFAAGLIGAGVTIGFAMLGNALSPIRPARQDDGISFASSPTYGLNRSSNDMRTGYPVPKVYGRHRVFPARIVDDYTEVIGQDEYLYLYLVAGYGPLHLEDWRIGETSVSLFDGVAMEVRYGYAHEPPVTLFPFAVFQEPMQVQLVSRDGNGVQMDKESWWVTRSTPDDVSELSWDIQFPQGSYIANPEGQRFPTTMGHDMRYRTSATLTQPAGPWMGMTSRIAAAEYSFPVSYERGRWVYNSKTQAQEWVSSGPGTADSLVYVDNQGYTGVIHPGFDSVRGVTRPATLAANQILLATVTIKGSTITNVVLGAKALEAGIGASLTGQNTLYLSEGVITSDFTTYYMSGLGTDPAKAVRQTFKRYVPRGKYDVQVRRSAPESIYSLTVMDVMYWTALRGGDSGRQPYTGSESLARVAMRVKATNQLSGTLPVVSVIAHSILPDWDEASGTWVARPTRNPASCLRDALLGSGSVRPYRPDEIHEASLIEWWRWCDKYHYTCDMVYDTKSSLPDVLADIAACGRGRPAPIDGKLGVVWQHKQTGRPVGHITPRNSRDFRSVISYRDEVHGLHVKFLNADKDWERDELTIYAPGYQASNADPARFETIELLGTTEPPQAAIRARWHLNSVLTQRETYTVTMPLEYLRYRLGDKVRVVRPEILYGIGAAALKGWTVDEAGLVTSIVWDDILDASPDVRYLAVVRLGDGSEWTLTGTSPDGKSLVAEAPSPLPSPAPRVRDLVMVGSAVDVGRQCLVTGIRPGDDMTASLTLTDYIDALYENDGSDPPPFDPGITMPGTPSAKVPPTPEITAVRTDEWALAPVSGGGSQPRLWLHWVSRGQNLVDQVQYRRQGETAWTFAPALSVGVRETYIAGVEEKAVYDVRVRSVDANTGLTSEWAVSAGVYITGRTTPPPPPDYLLLDGQRLDIVQNHRPLDVVGHEVWMALGVDSDFSRALLLTRPYVTGGIFDLAPWAGKARRVFVRTVDEIGLVSEPVAVAVDFGDARPDNVLFEYSNREHGWPGTVIDGETSHGDLISLTDGFLWSQNPDAPLWAADGGSKLWPGDNARQMRYQFGLAILPAYAGARLSLDVTLAAGAVRFVEYRVADDKPLWPQDDDTPLWDQDSDAPLWRPRFLGEWTAMPDFLRASGGEYLEFRVTFDDGTAAVVPDITLVIDVEDREYVANDLSISGTETRIPLPPGYFRAITAVTIGIQHFPGQTASKVERWPGSEVIEDGFVALGPIVVAVDYQQQTTDAVADFVVKGY